MKKTIKQLAILSVFIFSLSTINAQAIFTTNEVRQFMSKGEQNGIEIILNGTKPEDAKDVVEKFGKKLKAKIVRDKKSPEIFIDNAQIPTVSANAVDMYVITTPVDNGTKITFFTDLGGAFVSSAAYGTQYAGLEALIKKFAKDQAINLVEDQQKSEEKILKSLKGDLKDLVKDKADYIKEIEKSNLLIIQREQAIKVNDADLFTKQQTISSQQITDDKLLKSIKSEIKGLERKKMDYQKDITKAKSTIQQRETNIIKNNADQSTKQQQISLQEQIIETVKSKRATLNY